MTEQQDASTATNQEAMEGRKAWTAYAPAFVLAYFAYSGMSFFFPGAEALVALPVLGVLAYYVMLIRSYRLLGTSGGVVLLYGVLPWKKFRLFIAWRDIGAVNVNNGFWPWVTGIHTINVEHRFTLTESITVTEIRRGEQVADWLAKGGSAD